MDLSRKNQKKKIQGSIMMKANVNKNHQHFNYSVFTSFNAVTSVPIQNEKISFHQHKNSPKSTQLALIGYPDQLYTGHQ